MNEFKYFDDFNNEVKKIFIGINFQEIYVIKIKIEKHGNLSIADQNFLKKKKEKGYNFKETDEIVKLYSSASFHYVYKLGKIECNGVPANSELLDRKIFFPILFSDFKIALKGNKSWHFEINDERSIIIIAKMDNGIDELKKRVHEIFTLHTEYDSNSLNAKNMSKKKNNAIVEQYKKKFGFDLSLETTLSNIIKFIFDIYSIKNNIFLISLFKLSADDKQKLSWKEEHQLHNKAGQLTLNKDEFERVISNKISSHYFREEEKYADLKELTLPIGFSDEKFYYLVIPIAKSEKPVQFRYAMVLVGQEPFKTYILDNINGLLSEYYSCYLEIRKRELLIKLQSALVEINMESNGNPEKYLIELTKDAFKAVVQITNAYSATFRLFRPANGGLEKVVNIANREGENYSSEDNEHSCINVNEYRKTSLNCRAFCLQESEVCALYIPDIRSAQEKRLANKGFSTLKSRVQTFSELCVPFYYRGVVIGVMNFESPILHAFDEECKRQGEDTSHRKDNVLKKNTRIRYHEADNHDEYVELSKYSFIYTVKSTLQHFYCLISERNDIRHLSRLIERENSLHDLKNLVETNKDLNKFRDPIKKLLYSATTLSSFCNNPVFISQRLVDIRNYCIQNYYNDIGSFTTIPKDDFLKSENLNKYLPINLGENERRNITADQQMANSLEVIYKNLLKNYLYYGHECEDILSVKYNSAKNSLIITQEFFIPLEPNGSRFTSPHMGENSTSSGLFIVGTHVRQLGGYIFTYYVEVNRLKRYDIFIPIKDEEKKNEES